MPGVCVAVPVAVKVDVAVSVSVTLAVCVAVLSGVEVKAELSVFVGVEAPIIVDGVVRTAITSGGEDGWAAANTAPTIIKLMTLIVISAITNTRLVVSRKQTFFSLRIRHHGSSGFGHCSPGQNSKTPFFA